MTQESDKALEVELGADGTPMGDFQKLRTEALSEMFDDVSRNGIYPTTRFYARLDAHVRKMLREVAEEAKREEAAEWEKVVRFTMNPYDEDEDIYRSCDEILRRRGGKG